MAPRIASRSRFGISLSVFSFLRVAACIESLTTGWSSVIELIVALIGVVGFAMLGSPLAQIQLLVLTILRHCHMALLGELAHTLGVLDSWSTDAH